MNPQQDIITHLREQLSEARKTANELVDELTAHKEVLGMCGSAIKAALHNNGGVIGFDSTVNGKEYVMVLSEDFKGLESAFTTIAKLKEVGCE